MNDFEHQISIAPKVEDWYDQRSILSEIVASFIKDTNCTGYNIRRTNEIDKMFIQVVTFVVYQSAYFWIDYVIDGSVYISHLEKLENDMVIILYSSHNEKNPIFPKLLKHLNEYPYGQD